MATQARVAGTVKIDGVAAARDVIVIKDDAVGREVVAEGRSASDGTFDITYNNWAGSVVVLALDEYGDKFTTETALNMGQVVHPSTPNGYVYQVAVAGTTGTEEPTWSTSGSVTSGSVTFNALPYYRPVASGPLQGEITQFLYFEQLLMSESPSAAWLFNEVSGPVIDSVSSDETAFPSGTGITRGAAALPANSEAGEFSYLFSGANTDYFDPGHDDSFLQSPLFSVCVAFQIRDYQELSLQCIAGTSFSGNAPGFSIAYDNRQVGGTNLDTTTRAIRFYVSNGGGSGANVNAFQKESINDNLPHMLAAVYDGSVIRLFLDGVLVSDTVPMVDPVPATASDFLIGSSRSSDSSPLEDFCWDGRMDALAIWDGVALTDQQIADLAAKFFEEV